MTQLDKDRIKVELWRKGIAHIRQAEQFMRDSGDYVMAENLSVIATMQQRKLAYFISENHPITERK